MIRGMVVALALLVPSGSAIAEPEEVVIATGSVEGVYYKVGWTICGLVNQGTTEHGVSCRAEPAIGSIGNLQSLRFGKTEVGIAQSDWEHHAVNGTAAFADAGPFAELRSIFTLHAEPFTLVARRDTGIETLDDLKGARVNLGNPGSGQRATMDVVLEAKGWTSDDFSQTAELSATEQSLALCRGQIDAMVYMAGHPNTSIGQATNLCDAVLVTVKDEQIDALIEKSPYYRYTEIPGGLYRGNAEAVTTFGVWATVIATSNLSAEVVRVITEAVFENLETFRAAHPAFANLEADAMVTGTRNAPLHEGAKAYYVEAGLL